MLRGNRDTSKRLMKTQPYSPWGPHGGHPRARRGWLWDHRVTVPTDRDVPQKPPSPARGAGRSPSPTAAPAPRGPAAPPGPAAPLSPAHFKRPHLSPSAAFEPGEFPAGAGGSPRPLTVIENLRLMGFPRLGAQRLINLPRAGMGGPGGPQHRTPWGSPATALSGAPRPPLCPRPPACREHVLLINF